MRLLLLLSAVLSLCGATLRGQDTSLNLSEAERAWLAAHPVVRLGYDPDFKPFCFRDGQGRFQGIDADLFQLLGRKLGVRFEARTASTWSEIYQAAARGELDVLSSTADAPERRGQFLFTREYVRFPVTIVSREEGPFALTDSDLKHLRVAVVRDYVATLAFRRNHPQVALIECDSIESALLMVAEHRADATVTNLTNASYVIKTRGLTNLKIAGVVPEMFELRLAVPRQQPELQAILDKVLASLSPTDMAAILDRWVKVDYASVIRWDVVRRWAIVGTLFALTVIALVTWRNVSLARELVKRREVQLELERTNQQLNQANAELINRHDEKCEIMRVAAHDLRSPLTTISLSADLMNLDGVHESTRTIRNAADQMTHLIDDLLEVHALEEGRREFKREAVDLVPLLSGVAEAHAPTARAKNIELDLSDVGAVPLVAGDLRALRQVFDNLLSNALKFSPRERRIELRTRRWGRYARIEVRDQGPGVPADERERIFSKYARGSAKPTAGERSTGLGLAIVRDIVGIMNGRVWCENDPDGGAVFIVALPLADEATKADASGVGETSART